MSIDAATKPWTDYDIGELEQHFNPRAAVPGGVDKYDASRADDNAKAMVLPNRKADIAYGDAELETLDIYTPEGAAGPLPVHVFIHGGYWRARDKKDFAFLAAALARQGLLTVVINYPLCPVVKLDDVVASARKAFAWVVRNIAEHGGDPDRITLSGHSAGAHLGAAILANNWTNDDLGQNPLKGAVLVSGIYDPAPTQHVSVNPEIGITPEIADRNKFVGRPVGLHCPVHVIVGGAEPKGWIDQSVDYAKHLRGEGLPTELTITGQENHFSLMDQYVDPTADVQSAIMRFARP